jgi:hypothetical protein
MFKVIFKVTAAWIVGISRRLDYLLFLIFTSTSPLHYPKLSKVHWIVNNSGEDFMNLAATECNKVLKTLNVKQIFMQK